MLEVYIALTHLQKSSLERELNEGISSKVPILCTLYLSQSYNAFWSVKIPCKQNPRDHVCTDQAAENPINKHDKNWHASLLKVEKNLTTVKWRETDEWADSKEWTQMVYKGEKKLLLYKQETSQ